MTDDLSLFEPLFEFRGKLVTDSYYDRRTSSVVVTHRGPGQDEFVRIARPIVKLLDDDRIPNNEKLVAQSMLRDVHRIIRGIDRRAEKPF